mmetsp:Transcript_13936/g.27398  ORF Transcript_13936/g.27398 Transcript_13936/m.27398 type:complete len:105 (-) Transcript_13936:95-409(-)
MTPMKRLRQVKLICKIADAFLQWRGGRDIGDANWNTRMRPAGLLIPSRGEGCKLNDGGGKNLPNNRGNRPRMCAPKTHYISLLAQQAFAFPFYKAHCTQQDAAK